MYAPSSNLAVESSKPYRMSLPSGHIVLIDEIDMDETHSVNIGSSVIWSGRVADLSWGLDHDLARSGYVTAVTPRSFTDAPKKRMRLHRLIMNARKGDIVDHRDTNRLNNLRSNLRFASFTQNSVNRSRNRSQRAMFKGIYAQGNRWGARLQINKKSVHLGAFGTQEKAARAYDKAALAAWGEFARLNFPNVLIPELATT